MSQDFISITLDDPSIKFNWQVLYIDNNNILLKITFDDPASISFLQVRSIILIYFIGLNFESHHSWDFVCEVDPPSSKSERSRT